MVNKIVFDRQRPLTWHTRNLWHRKDQAEDYIHALKNKYRFRKCFTASNYMIGPLAAGMQVFLIVVEFKNEADEAYFIMKESI